MRLDGTESKSARFRAIQREQRRKRIHGRTTSALRGHAAIVGERVAVASTMLSMLSAVILAAFANGVKAPDKSAYNRVSIAAKARP